MLGFLFRGLMAEPARGAPLFATLTGEARKPHWYVEGAVPDTVDGRFAVLATIVAMALWLFRMADSMTSLSCFVLAAALIMVIRHFGTRRPATVHVESPAGGLTNTLINWRAASP